MACASSLCASFTCSRSGSTNRLTSTPPSTSVFTIGRSWTLLSTTSSPPSVVSSSRRSATSVTCSGLTVSAVRSISWVAASSRWRRVRTTWRSTSRSRSWMCRRSARRWTVIPCAPPSSASTAACTGSGSCARRAWRTVATWSMLTPSRATLSPSLADHGVERDPARAHDEERQQHDEVHEGQLGVAPGLERLLRQVAQPQAHQEVGERVVLEERRHEHGEGGERRGHPREQAQRHQQPAQELAQRGGPGEEAGHGEAQLGHRLGHVALARDQRRQLGQPVDQGQAQSRHAEQEEAEVLLGHEATATSRAAASASSLDQSRRRRSSGPSSMMRSLGSVPLQRTSTRPSAPKALSTRCWAWASVAISLSGRRAGSVMLSSTCGTRSIAVRDSSDRDWPVRIMSASTCNAAMMPSPVV